MKDRIVIVGAGGAGFAQTALQNMGHENVIIVSPEELRQETFPKSKPIVIHAHPALKSYNEGKEFICKGKHQYRLIEMIKNEKGNGTFITEVWACQCGRKL
jgi:thioredoxin reductase